MTKLQNAVSAVLDRREHYKEARDYYEGAVPETFAGIRLRRLFRAASNRSNLNFCRPVVDAVNDRLSIAAVVGTTQKATDALGRIWEQNEMALDQKEIHRTALEYGDAYAMVWPDENGDLLISVNTPLTTSIVYDPENPRKKLYGVKLWVNEGISYLNIYKADEVVKYRAKTDTPDESTEWSFKEKVPNPFGEIPLFHFRTLRPYGRPEHYDAYDCQNAINKLFITNMFTIDYQGAPQRYALTKGDDTEAQDFDESGQDRENVGALKNGPGELWYLKGVTNVGEFKPADPNVFWSPIKDSVRTLASLTSTPLHYFEKTGNIPSGEALRVAESPLMKKVVERQTAFGAAWRDLFRFILRVENITSDVQIKWDLIEAMDSGDAWDVLLKKINAGLSIHQALREAGYDEDVITAIMAERAQEAAEGLFYQRAPQVRVSTSNNETLAVQGGNDG